MVSGRGGAVFGGQGQLGALAAHIEIGVAPAMQFARTAQRLAGAAGVGVFAGVMHDHDGQLELPLEFPQKREQRGDLGGVVFIHPMQPDERDPGSTAQAVAAGRCEKGAGGRWLGVQPERGRGNDLHR